MRDFSLNSERRVKRLAMGREGAPLIIIDDAFADPAGIAELAATAGFETVRGRGNHFPGVRSPLPDEYAEAMGTLIDDQHTSFGLAAGAAGEATLNHLQMVTTPRAELSLPQRLPHFDTFDPNQVACLHYLTEEDRGGTDFYRHRATGFERISPERFRPYTETLVAEVRRLGHPPADYITKETEQFERIERVDAVFNRVILYFSNSLHSGRIPDDAPLSADPQVGRLMASVFLRFGDLSA
ncbi:MAG: DUF6445 family protein [Pseudomonadota bacterium]